MSVFEKTSDFLVISRVGGSKLYQQWLGESDSRGFDLYLSFYKNHDRSIDEAKVFHEYRPGKKVEGYSAILKEYRTLVSQYQYVALLDDDLQISTSDLTALLNIARKHSFRISQPSLTLDSYYTYAALLQDPLYEYRAINFIEMMCPIFRSDMIELVEQLFSIGMESGIDLIWCNTHNPRPGDFAVIDEISVKHLSPVGERKSENGFVGAMQYEDQIFKIMKDYDIPWLPCVPFFGLTKNGQLVRNRALMLLASLKIYKAIWQQKGISKRARAVGVYWKHMAFRRAENLNIVLSGAKQ